MEVLILILIGLFFGTRNEKKHLAKLEKNEHLLGHIIISNERFYEPSLAQKTHSSLVMGNVVIAQDYFKMFAASILNFFGQNLTTYETLLDRARREAIVRMKQQAAKNGHNQIYGVRLEVSTINETGQMVEAIAYGTSMTTVGNKKVPPALPKL